MIFLLGCLDRLLEAPYVLTPGLSEPRSIGIAPDGGLLVTTRTGAFHIDGEGRAEQVGEPAEAVSGTPGHTWYLRKGQLEGGERALAVPGAVDVLGGWEGLLVLYPDHVERVNTSSLERTPVRLPVGDARAIALGPTGAYLVVTPAALLELQGDTANTLVAGLVDARAAATDTRGRIYVAQGKDPALYRVDAGTLTLVAQYLDDPRDLHFGVGGLLPVENVYVANGAGTVDYLRPP